MENRILRDKIQARSNLIREPTSAEVSCYGWKPKTIRLQDSLGVALLAIGIGGVILIFLNMKDRLGQLEAEVQNLLRVQRIISESLKAERPVGILNNLGTLYLEAGRYTEAQLTYERALNIAAKSKAEQAAVYNNLSTLLLHRGNLTEALRYSVDALELARKQGSILEEAKALQNMGFFYLASAEPEKAEAYFQRTLDLQRELLGAGHPAIVDSLVGLADAKARSGKYHEAEALYRQALEIAEDRELSNQQLVRVLGKLVEVLEKMGRMDEARVYQERAIGIWKGAN